MFYCKKVVDHLWALPLIAFLIVFVSLWGRIFEPRSVAHNEFVGDPVESDHFKAISRPCAPGCTSIGNCNSELGQCECPFGRKGEHACLMVQAVSQRWQSSLIMHLDLQASGTREDSAFHFY